VETSEGSVENEEKPRVIHKLEEREQQDSWATEILGFRAGAFTLQLFLCPLGLRLFGNPQHRTPNFLEHPLGSWVRRGNPSHLLRFRELVG
jgi:hypothetical protein